ncbi:MAG TPA: TraR/DksA C4-type zinc finger protein [Myxococcota bacterium]|nr:TraR/DksA C4-type zinc finger protein [Myxococcota bacterium]
MILEELCAAKHWSPCVGLVECDVLSLPQKRTLLVARATSLREEDGATGTLLAGISHDRTTALADLRKTLLGERKRIVAENRRLEAEMAALEGVLGREEITDDIERASAESGIDWGDARERLTVRRLDSIDRALDAMALGNYGVCKACGAAIEIERLRLVPDARSCSACARSAPAPR